MPPNNDPALCDQLHKIIITSAISRLTNSELCDFQLSKLAPEVRAGVSFPDWKEIKVANPRQMYLRMQAANRAPHSVAKRPDNTSALLAIAEAARDRNIVFYRARIPMITYKTKGTANVRSPVKSVVMVMMNFRHCSATTKNLPVPFYAAFENDGLSKPIPNDAIPPGEEVAIWQGWTPILISLPLEWMQLGRKSYETVITANSLWESGARTPEKVLAGSSLCGFNVMRNAN